MKIKKLLINGYGKFIDTEITLKSGLNLIFGKNEAGKSTLQSFIKAMLFDFPRKNVDGEGRLPGLKKYKPWSGSDFGGILEIKTDDGRILKIDRDFARKNASVFDDNLRDITSEFPYSKKNGLAVGENLLNMDRECFENTSFIKQGGTIVLQNDRKNLFEKLMNLSSTGSENTSAASAQAALSTASTNLGNTRTKKRPYNIALSEFNRLESKMEDINKRRVEMSHYRQQEQLLEKDLKILKEKISGYESAKKVVELKLERDTLLHLKGKYDDFSSKIQSLSDEIFTTRQKMEENQLPGNITESEILDNIKITASAIEKQKSIDEGDPESKLIKLEKSKRSKRLLLAICYVGITLTALLAFLFHTAIFALTAVVTAVLIYLHLKKLPYTADDLHAQILLKKECRQDMVLINAFIESAGCPAVKDFNEAEATLNELFEKKNQSAVLKSQVTRQTERKTDLENFRNQVLGQFDNIDSVNNALDVVNNKIKDAGLSNNAVNLASGTDPRIEFEEKQRRLSGVKAVLREYMQSDDEIAKTEELLSFYKDKLSTIQSEQRAMELASEIIALSAEKMQGEIIPKLNEKTGMILSKITDGSHSSLATGLDNEINTQFQNTIHSLWEFSDGTIDQMYFALRVAASEVFSEKESVPIIIDEAFAYYDESRIKSTFDFLSEIAKDKQIIVFTCKEKEVDLVSEYKGINIIRI